MGAFYVSSIGMENYPKLVSILVALFMFAYQTLGAIDDKQAERLDGPNLILSDQENLCAFARFCDPAGKIWSLIENPPNTFTRNLILKPGFNISSFWQDSAGELYVVDISGGRVLKIVPK